MLRSLPKSNKHSFVVVSFVVGVRVSWGICCGFFLSLSPPKFYVSLYVEFYTSLPCDSWLLLTSRLSHPFVVHFIDSAKSGPIYDWLGDLVPYPGRFKPKLFQGFFYGMVPPGVCLENFFPCTIVVPRPTFLLSNKRKSEATCCSYEHDKQVCQVSMPGVPELEVS